MKVEEIEAFLDIRIEEESQKASRVPPWDEDYMSGYIDALHEVRGYVRRGIKGDDENE